MDIDHKDDHICGEKQREACKEFYIGDEHRCFIKKLENTEAKKHGVSQYWVYDFESRMVNTEHGAVHEVDTVVAIKLYSDELESFTNLGEFVKWTMTQNAPHSSHTTLGRMTAG